MANDFFFFHGGPIKTGNPIHSKDDGIRRKPLTVEECHEVHRDPEVPQSYAPNAYTRWFYFGRYFNAPGETNSRKEDLAVGDRIYAAIYPDAIHYVGIYALGMTVLSGFTVKLALVAADDVATALAADPAADLSTLSIRGNEITYDFANSLGDASIDAAQKAKLNDGTTFDDYRNDAALKSGIFTTGGLIAPIGSPMYMRIEVTGLPAAPAAGDPTAEMPFMQFGVIGNDLGLNKQNIMAPDYIRRARASVDFI